MTLRFLGSVAPEALPEVTRAIGAAAERARPGIARLRGLGTFPGRRASVLWAGVEDDGTLDALAAGLASLPGPDAVRRFRPHLTLVRFDPPKRLEGLPALPGEAFGDPFPLTAASLFRTHPGAGGRRYEALGEFPFGR